MRLACINKSNLINGFEVDASNCIVDQVEELIDQGKLVSLIANLITFLQQLHDVFYFEYEIQNHNLLVIIDQDSGYDICLINQVLPLQYRVEFINHIKQIYQEEEYEMNERLAVKKVIFLLIALSNAADLKDLDELDKLYSQWKAFKIKIPEKSPQYDLFKLALTTYGKIKKGEYVSLANIKQQLANIGQPNNQQPSNTDLNKQANVNDPNKNKRGSMMEKKMKSRLTETDQSFNDDSNDYDSDDKDDFGIVPAINMDNDTVHIKIEDEPKFHQKSQLFMIDTDNEQLNPTGGYQSDVMKSLHMLGGSSGVTVKTNKFLDPNNEGGQSTVINVDQIRLNIQSSRGQHRKTIDELEKNPSAEDVQEEEEEEEEEEAPPKVFKGNMVKQILVRKQASSLSEEQKQIERVGIQSQDFNEKRDNIKYKNFGCTFVVKNAHSDRINCLCYLINGAYISGSSDKTIKVWYPLEQKPIGILDEDDEVTLMLRLGKTPQNDVTLVYVAKFTLKFLSIKQQKAIQYYRNSTEITAICKINSTNSIICLGTAKGVIMDFDLKNRCMIRQAKLHQGSKVTSIVSQGKYLISLSINGLAVIYDYPNQQQLREILLSQNGIAQSTSALLMKQERFLAITDEQGVNVIDKDSRIDVNTLMNTKGASKLLRLQINNDNQQQPVVGLFQNGTMRLWLEGQGFAEEESRHLDQLKQMSGHLNQVTDLIQLPNGSLVSSSYDKNINLWEEKKGMNACGGCCNIY
ncbi:wd-40 repeat-containing protein [Stylonychia lemnae]|uniref:Wd-40 repeat-containing protein n=1 Tax=Stylonychia lemnae TaxID=5949 RepID=A0A077ZU93_STYLE|nr:wd-40 repeat-containing protein [Stylonychia lemnae]|eukprot:CDW72031.1 wd-40 repeat-containing protein [Stylonychia lemnae]